MGVVRRYGVDGGDGGVAVMCCGVDWRGVCEMLWGSLGGRCCEALWGRWGGCEALWG